MQRINYATSLLNSQRLCLRKCPDRCNITSIGCYPVSREKTERFCPFDEMVLMMFNYQFFTRMSVKLLCRRMLTSTAVTKLGDVRAGLYNVQSLRDHNNLFANCLRESSSRISDFPKSISLDTGSCFYFAVYLYLDHDEHQGQKAFNSH